MKAIIILNYASEEDIGKKTSIRLANEENEWIEEVVIKPIPQHDYYRADTYLVQMEKYRTGYADGWNDCLEELEK